MTIASTPALPDKVLRSQLLVVEKLEDALKKGESVHHLAWIILGGNQFMPKKPHSDADFLKISYKGIPKISVLSLARILEITTDQISFLLSTSRRTLGRRKITDILDVLMSSLCIEMSLTIALGLALFKDYQKFLRWLRQKNPAIQSKTPYDLLNTPTGIKTVHAMLAGLKKV